MTRARPARAAFALALCVTVGCASRPPAYSGTVQTESVAVGSLTGGRVASVAVGAGTRVRRGSLVLALESSQPRAQYEQASGEARQAAERLAELEHGNIPSDIARASAQTAQAAAQFNQIVAQRRPQRAASAASVREAAAALRLARRTYERMRALEATGDVSHQTVDQARSDFAQARARLAQARANFTALVAAQQPGEAAGARANVAALRANEQTIRNGPRSEEIAQARGALAAAQAATRYARARLDEVVVNAPVDGIVASFNLHRGDLLAPNQTAAIIDTFADPYAYIYASQRDLGALASGTHLRVVSDAGTASYDGVVEAHDRSAQFTPQNVETADQRADLVYGVKVRIHDPEHRLLDGTTVTVYPR